MVKRLRDHVFVCAHNAYLSGRFQVFSKPNLASYKRALDMGIRSLEIDLHTGLFVNHGRLANLCWYRALPFEDVIECIATHENQPLFLFIENHLKDESELNRAYGILKFYFGEKLLRDAQQPCWDRTLEEVAGKVIIISKMNTPSQSWNSIVSDHTYSSTMLNVPAVKSNLEKVKASDRVVRIYPRNLLLSTNYDMRPWLNTGKCTFISMNIQGLQRVQSGDVHDEVPIIPFRMTYASCSGL